MTLSALDAPPGPRRDARDVAVVLAHPDDETIGCGALLSRLDGVRVVCLTDGAPRNDDFARWAGFADSAALAAARRQELSAALSLAGVGADQVIRLGLMDQELGRTMAPLARDLAALFGDLGIAQVLTHAYEGGHPDHDATAFATRAAARLLGAKAPTVHEMPFYHLGADGMVRQTFCDGPEGLALSLTPAEIALKQAMMAAHATQGEVLAGFDPRVERLRPAGAQDFRALPNGGRMLYGTFVCAFTPQDWLPHVTQARADLGLD